MQTRGKVILAVVLFVVLMVPLSIGIRACGLASRMVDDGIETAYEEFKPSELLRKYEWFKNASAQLDKKKADIAVAGQRMKTMQEDYVGTPRKDWPRSDREQYNLWSSEVAGIKMSYNTLAAEYNSQMAKFNWRFTNAGDLPKGATEPLPREYKPYETN